MESEQAVIERVAQALAQASSVLFITGAGISADSGLPTYRGIGGLYNSGDTDEGIPIEVALSGQMFSVRPELTWKYIHQIEAACRGAGPNRAHEIIAELEGLLPRVWVLTQNVDGLHSRAGSDKVINIHGDVHNIHCTSCEWSAEVEDYSEVAPCPSCPDCEAVVRPRVVLFGEMLPPMETMTMSREVSHGFDVVVSIGTTSVFPYIAEPVIRAKHRGDLSVEINPGSSEVSEIVDVRLRCGAAEAMTAIWSAFRALS
jgi:NAD-dependent deacetylase